MFTVSNGAGLSGIDSVIVTVSQFVVNAGTDKTHPCGIPVQLGPVSTTYAGSGALTYSWLPVTGLNNPNIATPLCNSISNINYRLSVTSSEGCVGIDSVNVTVPLLTVEAGTNKNIICGMPVYLDSVTTSYSGGGSLTYLWNPVTGLNDPTIPRPICSSGVNQTYYVTVTTPDGCVAYDSVKVTQSTLQINAGTDISVICGNNVQLGPVTSNYQGTGTLSYLWNNSSLLNNSAISNPVGNIISSTSFIVTVTSSGGCSAVDTIDITKMPFVANAGSDVFTTCGNSIQIEATSTYGTAGVNYIWAPSISLNNSTIANPVASPIVSTYYSVTVTTPEGCTAIDSVLVDVNPFVVDAGPNLQAVCGSPVMVNSVITGYTGPGTLIYNWSPAAGLNSISLPTPTATIITNNRYYVTLTTPNGCVASDSLDIMVNPVLINAGTDKTVSCGNTVQLGNIISNYTGNGIISYMWTPSTYLNSPIISNPIYTAGNTTMYYSTFQTSEGCYAIDSVLVSVNELTNPFSEVIASGFPNLRMGSSLWGDYNNDGSWDAFMCGFDGSNRLSQLYSGNGTSFILDNSSNIEGLRFSSADWSDYDNDGSLDLLISGQSQTGNYISLMKNDGNGDFSAVPLAGIPAISFGMATWGDYNNDGLSDILVSGSLFLSLYRNNGNNTFTNVNLGNSYVFQYSSADWGDYNNDGNLDFIVTGLTGTNAVKTIIYRNNGNSTFTEITSTPIIGVMYGCVKWFDYNNDSYLDIVIAGDYNNGGVGATKLYKNNGDGTFVVESGLPNETIESTNIGICDYNNDGLSDILFIGGNSVLGMVTTSLYLNNGNNTFTKQTGASITGLEFGSISWGDYNKDQRMDLLITGNIASGSYTGLYKNLICKPNNPPLSPNNFTHSVNGNNVLFSWDAAMDDHTSQSTLTYNIYVKELNSSKFVLSPLSNLLTGERKIVKSGNVGFRLNMGIHLPFAGKYIAGVQTIDNSFFGSLFCQPDTFEIALIAQADNNVNITCGESTLLHVQTNSSPSETLTYNWSPSEGLSATNISNPLVYSGNSTTYYVTVTNEYGQMGVDSVNVTVEPAYFAVSNDFSMTCGEENNIRACQWYEDRMKEKYFPHYNDFMLDDLFFVNDSVGFMICGMNNDTLLKTTTNGLTWQKIATGNGAIYGIAFKDNLHGWLLGEQVLYETTDGGYTWNTTPVVNNGQFLEHLYLFNDSTLFIGQTNPAVIFKVNLNTYDYIEVVPQNSPSGFVDYLKMTSENVGYILINDFTSEIYKTTDGGLSWNLLLNASSTVVSTDFGSDLNGFVNANQNYYITNDGGLTWQTTTNLPTNYGFYNVKFGSPNYALMIGQKLGLIDRIFETKDGGYTWAEKLCPPTGSDYFLDLYFKNPYEPYILGLHKLYIPYLFDWTPVLGLDDPHSSDPMTSLTSSTVYYATAYTQNGCSITDSLTITIDSLTVNAGSDKNIICGGSTQLNNLSTNYNGSSPLMYQWSPSEGLSNPNLSNPFIEIIATDTYIVTVSNSVGCTATDSLTVNVNPLVVNVTNNTISCGGSAVLNAYTNYTGSDILSYSWTPTIGLSNNTIYNPTVQVYDTTVYNITVQTPNGCEASNNLTVSTSTLNFVPEICIVGVSPDNHNRVIWVKPTLLPIDSFYIYRENYSQAGNYLKIGSVSYADSNIFVDVTSNPTIQSSRYKVSVFDGCGLETSKSPSHKTMHLNINQGMGTTWNLMWEEYEGFAVNNYFIYRGTSSTNLIQIGSVAGGSYSFSDLTAPPGIVYYQVEVIGPNDCSVTGTKSNNSTRSNIVTNDISSIDLLSNDNITFEVYPNPFNDFLNVKITDNEYNKYSITITDIAGREIFKKENVLPGIIKIDKLNLAPGAYNIHIIGNVTYNTMIITY